MSKERELLRELHDLSSPVMTALLATKKRDDLLLADKLHHNWTTRYHLLANHLPQKFDSEDHEAIALIIREAGDVSHNAESHDIMIRLAVFFQQDNPRFDSAQFFTLCGRENAG